MISGLTALGKDRHDTVSISTGGLCPHSKTTRRAPLTTARSAHQQYGAIRDVTSVPTGTLGR